MTVSAEILRQIKYDNFIVIDLETTGLDPTQDKIIEIGAVRFVDGQEDETFETLINPEQPIPDFITKLTGIKDEDVADSPKIDDKFEELQAFIGLSPLVGHQVNFDISFLEYHLRKTHQDFDKWENDAQRFKYLSNTRLDTLFLSRIFLPFLPKFKLSAVASYFNIDLENAHRAIEDSRATGLIFLELIARTLACDISILKTIIRLLYRKSARVKNYFQPILDTKLAQNIDVSTAGLAENLTYAQEFYNIIGEADYRVDPIEMETPNYPTDDQKVVE